MPKKLDAELEMLMKLTVGQSVIFEQLAKLEKTVSVAALEREVEQRYASALKRAQAEVSARKKKSK